MSLTICRGTPTLAGRYVVYVGDMSVPTEIRIWNNGWLPNLKEPHTPGDVIGWVGPLPVFKFDGEKIKPAEMEYDL